MKWPWAKTEDRAAGGFTELLVGQLLAQAGGNVYADVSNTAAAELAAGLWGRAFASAELTPAMPGIGPETLSTIARDLILQGEYLAAIEVRNGALELRQSYSWDVTGGADPAMWSYVVELPGPSTTVTRALPAEGVVHCRYSTDPATPWRGVGPFQRASLTGAMLAGIERQLSQEAGGASGYAVPTPKNPDDKGGTNLDTLRSNLAAMKGKTGVVETMAAGWGGGVSMSPRGREWGPVRFGMDAPSELRELREDAAEAMIATCVPPGLAFGNTDGTAAREAMRRWFHTSIAPIARMVGAELSLKLEAPVVLSFPGLEAFASDTVGKARTVGQLVQAGVSVDDAIVKAGFID